MQPKNSLTKYIKLDSVYCCLHSTCTGKKFLKGEWERGGISLLDVYLNIKLRRRRLLILYVSDFGATQPDFFLGAFQPSLSVFHGVNR
jgi:hypothetical protein